MQGNLAMPKPRLKPLDISLSSDLCRPYQLNMIPFWLRRICVSIVVVLGTLLQPTESMALSFSAGGEKIEIPIGAPNLEAVLKPVPVPPVSGRSNPNLVPNPSVEVLDTYNSSLPSGGWETVANARSSVSYDLVAPGHTGNRALKVTIKNYGGGEAYWKYPPQPVRPGKTYEFSDTYISDVDTSVWLHFTDKNGAETVTWLGDSYRSSDWNNFYGQFTVPENVVSVGIYQSISSQGYLITDDYRLDEYAPIALHRPLISLTFDDALDPVYTNGLPLLQKYGFLSTQFIPTGFIDRPGRFTRKMLQTLSHFGHEIGSHSVTHPALTSLTKAQLDQELMQSQQDLFAITGIRPTSLATPFGAYNTSVIQDSSNYFRSMRNVNVGFNSRDNADAFDIKVQNITATTTLNNIATWVAKAKADRTWLVLVYHNLSQDPVNSGLYNTTPSDLEKHLQLIRASGVTVLPVNQAVLELKAQSTN